MDWGRPLFDLIAAFLKAVKSLSASQIQSCTGFKKIYYFNVSGINDDPEIRIEEMDAKPVFWRLGAGLTAVHHVLHAVGHSERFPGTFSKDGKILGIRRLWLGLWPNRILAWPGGLFALFARTLAGRFICMVLPLFIRG